MSDQFDIVIARMPGLLKALRSSSVVSRDTLRGIPERGVYAFYEKDVPLYVGRSNQMKERLLRHSQPSSMHETATFAFLLAIEKAKDDKELWECATSMTRTELQSDKKFSSLYQEAKLRVSNLDIRVVEVTDPIDQTVFEVYAALQLQTPYNSFENH